MDPAAGIWDRSRRSCLVILALQTLLESSDLPSRANHFIGFAGNSAARFVAKLVPAEDSEMRQYLLLEGKDGLR